MIAIKTDILILGAGIGGYETYRTLAKLLKSRGLNKKITLIDQNNYFTFVPMLHEVVSGSIEPSHCTIPLHKIISAPHEFYRATVTNVNPETNTVITSTGTITYDKCVIALGSDVNYFGVPGAAEFALNCRTLPSALDLRGRLVNILEGALNEIKIVMVGGGYTGAEVAGQVAEFAKKYIHRFFPNKKISLTIVESAPTILNALPPLVQTKVAARLTKMGVNIMAGKRVQKITLDSVEIEGHPALPSDITIWTAGIQNMAPCFLDEKFCLNSRLAVNEHLQVDGFSNLYAIGDIALFKNPSEERPAPQLGETAHKMGEFAAKHIANTYQNKQTGPFIFRSLGTLMPIGDWWGAAVIGKFIFFGRLAWWIRRTVYVMFMPGLTKKIKIIIDWTWHIFGVRDIISIDRKNK